MEKIKYLALIPARGGQQSIPNKNLYTLNGRPLIDYTIEAANQIFLDVVVSSEDLGIIAHCKKLGISFPYTRSKELSQPDSHRNDLVLELLEFYEQQNTTIENIVFLQPTSPLRNANHIKKALELFELSPIHSLVSVSKPIDNPFECIHINGSTRSTVYDFQAIANRQSYSGEWYFDNGAIYIFNVEYFKQHRCFYNLADVLLFEMDKKFSIDINDEQDFFIAESILRNLKN